MMPGDTLARGARSATFGPAKISQAKWDAIWAEDKPKKPKTIPPIPSKKKNGQPS